MWMAEMLDEVPELEEGMVPVFKWGIRTAIPLRKYFYDISVFLWVKRIEHLFQNGTGINVARGKNGIKISVNFHHLDDRYIIKQDPQGNIWQNGKQIRLPKPHTPARQTSEVIGVKPVVVDTKLEERVSELEKIIIRLNNQLQSEK
jgi:hypothetical protein